MDWTISNRCVFKLDSFVRTKEVDTPFPGLGEGKQNRSQEKSSTLLPRKLESFYFWVNIYTFSPNGVCYRGGGDVDTCWLWVDLDREEVITKRKTGKLKISLKKKLRKARTTRYPFRLVLKDIRFDHLPPVIGAVLKYTWCVGPDLS